MCLCVGQVSDNEGDEKCVLCVGQMSDNVRDK